MKRLSLSFPTILLKREDFPKDWLRSYNAVQNIIRVVKAAYTKTAQAVNAMYDGDIASAGGATASRPASPRLYQQYYDTTISKLVLWDGTNWVDTMGVVS